MPQMYRANRQVTDMEIEWARGRVPESRFKQEVYRDLFQKVLAGFIEGGLNMEDYILRYDSRRDCIDHGQGREWFTLYELTAIPLEDARRMLGVRY